MADILNVPTIDLESTSIRGLIADGYSREEIVEGLVVAGLSQGDAYLVHLLASGQDPHDASRRSPR